MDKELLSPLSGFRDLTDKNKEEVIEAIRTVFQCFGYTFLETPSLERQEILLNKFGDEAQKLLYLFEDNGRRPVGLRYDLTISLSRYVAGHFNELVLPYKRYEIGPVWRADRAQKGRLRQFTQADIDIVGSNSLGGEKELLEVIAQVQQALSPSLDELVCLVNDRRVVLAVLDKMIITDSQPALLQLLDKRDKISETVMQTELNKLGLSDVQLRQVQAIFLADESEAMDVVEEFLNDPAVTKPVTELLAYAKTLGLKAVFSPSMVRGLDYYTGSIIESKLPNYAGSLVGGGRYDSLVESLNGQKVPAVGISFGVDRLVDAGAAVKNTSKAVKAYFSALLPETEELTRAWALQVRSDGVAIELYPDSSVELGKQLKYADKRGFEAILLPFETEWSAGDIVEKNLETGVQCSLKRSELAKS